FLLAAVAALLSALAYAEFAARVPLSGSAYTFAYVTLGELAAWFIGSNLTLEYSISASAVARGFSVNMAQMLSLWGAQLPAWLVGMPLNAYLDLSPLSALLIMVCTLTLCLGVQSSARFNIAMTVLNVSVILFVVLLGASSMQLANFTPFVPNGYLAVLSGTGTVFFSFVGFDSVSTLAGEVKNPSRDLPLGICGTLGVATFLYVAVSVVICGMVSYQLIDVSAPLSAAFQSVGLDWAASVIAVASLVALTATTLCSLLGQPRIFYQMAVDGLLWPVFSKVDSRAVPIWGTIISGGFSALIALFVDLQNLTEMISIGTLMAFALVCAGVIIIRYRPDQPLTPAEDAARTRVLPPRFIPLLVVGFTVSSILFAASCVAQWGLWFSLPLALPPLVLYGLLQLQVPVNIPMTFSCPLVPLLPCLGILANIFIIVGLPIESAYRVIIWSVLCFIIYFAYGLHHSRLNRV
ncbi:MAG: amino acid permease, partial [archaeon]|nr:amino acid permease [archaeon]